MEGINFHNIANINCSKKEIKDDDEKVFIYSNDDDSDNIPPRNQNRNKFNDSFYNMLEKLNKLSRNAPDILKNKKFSNKILLEKYSNIQAFKNSEDLNRLKFKSSNEIQQISSNNISNVILMNSNRNNSNNILNNDLNIINNSRSSNSSGRNRSFTENKRKRQNSINGRKKMI